MRLRTVHAVGAALVVLASVTVPALAATTFPGSITIVAPSNGAAIRDTFALQWTFKTGTKVPWWSRVTIAESTDRVRWNRLAGGFGIRTATYQIDTTTLTNGAHAFRISVNGTTISSTSTYIVDNADPVIQISRPSNGSITVDGDTTRAPAVVVGFSPIEAVAEDGHSGVASVVWTLDDEEIAQGAVSSFDFGANPGSHTLTATVTDRAGNQASSSISILALPGQSQIGTPSPSPVPTVTPTDLPTTPPTTPPTLPPVPEPSIPPTTPPSIPPTPLPTPTSAP